MNSYQRRAKEFMDDARRASREMEAEHRERNRDPNAKTRREQWMQSRAEQFDALQVGDSLESFGLRDTVQKKNRKSIVSSMGTRWTRYELTGVK